MGQTPLQAQEKVQFKINLGPNKPTIRVRTRELSRRDKPENEEAALSVQTKSDQIKA